MTVQAALSFALAFAHGSATSLLAGAVLAGVLALVRRLRPGMMSQRRVWLLAMAAVAGTFVLAQWPVAAPWRVLPAIEVVRPAAPAASALAVDGAGSAAAPVAAGAGMRSGATGGESGMAGMTRTVAAGGSAIAGTLALAGVPAPAWLIFAAAAWLLCYSAGLMAAVLRWRRGAHALRGLLAAAEPLDAGGQSGHAGFHGAPCLRGLTVLETGAAVSPMLAGLWRPVLLLPRHLRNFGARQQQLIVAHELAHWRRRDHWWLHASLLLQTVLWFNPALRMLARGLAQAQELGCDRHVLAGQPVALRRDYAAALVAQLRVQCHGAGMAAAFGGSGAAALSERLRQMRQDDLGWSGRLAGVGRLALGACCAAVLAGSVVLQPAFAWRTVPAAEVPGGAAAPGAAFAPAQASAPASVSASGPAWPTWQAPLAHMSVASPYGPRHAPVSAAARFHHGIDLRAARGTPLLAPADGTVADVTDRYQGEAKYGKVIVIDHGDGLRSVYAHLEQWTVHAGERVAAGQPIGKTGNTGKTTGPHLHVEVLRHGEHIDPQRLIAQPRPPAV
jgi:hypothetical protein